MTKLHPLSLILAALWFSTAAIFVPQLTWLTFAFLLCAIFRGLLTGFNLQLWWKQIKKMIPLFIAIIIIQLLFTKKGDLLWGKSWYAIYSVGLHRSIAVNLRLLILFFSAQILLILNYEDFDIAFSALHLPEEFAFMIFYTIHIIPSASEHIQHSLQLVKFRGINMRNLSLKSQLTIYRDISLSVLANVLSHSEIEAIALDLRGFRSAGKHTHLLQKKFSLNDLILYLFITVVTLIYLFSILT
ncbi:MAG: energy-coupling factor transporter transmembrane component T [Candidatus Cloacimonadaceae bacterium]|jgi:energy-coupling factor transport system permease protein|nr:energy-coupling factor transporter transmembrane protein EcfT [Candidatus Cloacimonadota bacterium]MDD5625254.1 energy-coupling factor transporter transmembrane component T [Candidatus Cloacimonadota bacterium]MDY0111929.1 energy-coupling factor transporter transmembrane component T [Candidatus Syntrophosphaera sp.]